VERIWAFLAPAKLADSGMGLGMLFVVGLITSVHCLAMCGGINISQTLPSYTAPPAKGGCPRRGRGGVTAAALYNLGRIISYTLVGGIVGAVGSVFDFSSRAEAIIKLVAGLFMVVMALNMLGIFPILRYLQPRLPQGLAAKLDKKRENTKRPLVVGLLNGLMPCGPLQAMQIYALGTGSAILGALSMFVFSLGTVPLVFAFGAAGSALGSRFGKKVVKIGAVFVLILGVSMLMQSWNLSGINMGGGKTPASVRSGGDTSVSTIEGGVQYVKSELDYGGYPEISVKKDMPVVWTIDAPEEKINGCN
jgi:sulfite exporter TauE/SafE